MSKKLLKHLSNELSDEDALLLLVQMPVRFTVDNYYCTLRPDGMFQTHTGAVIDVNIDKIGSCEVNPAELEHVEPEPTVKDTYEWLKVKAALWGIELPDAAVEPYVRDCEDRKVFAVLERMAAGSDPDSAVIGVLGFDHYTSRKV